MTHPRRLYIADAKNNRILRWTNAAGFSTVAELPPSPPEGGDGIARIDLTGTEAEIVVGLKKPVRVLALGASSSSATRSKAPFCVCPSDKQVVAAKVPEPDLLCAGLEGTFFTGGKAGSVRQVLGSGEVKELSGGFQDVRGVAYDGKNKRLFVADHDRNEADGITHLLRILPVD